MKHWQTIDPETLARIAFPDVEKFADLFDDFAIMDNHEDTPFDLIPIEHCKESHIGSFCSTTRLEGEHIYLRVKPNSEVIDAVKKRALTDYDRMYFELVDRGNGTVLVVAKSNAILQSIWLALIPSPQLYEVLAS